MADTAATVKRSAEFYVVIRASAELSEYERWQVGNWQAQTFDLSEAFAAVDWYVFGIRDEQWVSMLEIAKRRAIVGAHSVILALIGSVVTVPQWRRHGYASAVLRYATTFLCQQPDVGFGLLLCLDDMATFYQQRGWQQVAEPLLYDQPSGKVQSDQNTMVYICQDLQWPQGIIDLCGL